jgi:hypothetical protein
MRQEGEKHTLAVLLRLSGRSVILVGEGPAADAQRRLLERAGARIVAEGAKAALAIVVDDAGAVSRLKVRGTLVYAVDRPDLSDFSLAAPADRRSEPAAGVRWVAGFLKKAPFKEVVPRAAAGKGTNAQTADAQKVAVLEGAAGDVAALGATREPGALTAFTLEAAARVDAWERTAQDAAPLEVAAQEAAIRDTALRGKVARKKAVAERTAGELAARAAAAQKAAASDSSTPKVAAQRTDPKAVFSTEVQQQASAQRLRETFGQLTMAVARVVTAFKRQFQSAGRERISLDLALAKGGPLDEFPVGTQPDTSVSSEIKPPTTDDGKHEEHLIAPATQ